MLKSSGMLLDALGDAVFGLPNLDWRLDSADEWLFCAETYTKDGRGSMGPARITTGPFAARVVVLLCGIARYRITCGRIIQ